MTLSHIDHLLKKDIWSWIKYLSKLKLQGLGCNGVKMACGNGYVQYIHPILASYVADYLEQCLVTCTKYGTCPKCHSGASNLGSKTPGAPHTQK